MGINTDLNVDPYYDDFDEAKQFNRVLFKPAKAVQARELTQLQTILQKQVERFGSNIYKEGTIISGINLTARDDLFYVKLNDKSGFSDPTIYDQVKNDDGTSTTFSVTGQQSQLKAEIIKGQDGFQTQDPDLKTFFIQYLNTSQDNQNDVKQFLQGETLEIRNQSGDLIQDVSVAQVADHAGRSFGVSCEEGVIYQKGHFIFVDNQFIIASKYSNVPGNVSVGFSIKENLIDSDTDATLLDNASGFNNENAPGADRLQLVPTLVSYLTASEPTEFFSLIRYVDGKPVRIRDKTEFNELGNELARRTYEESGNYVVSGLNLSLEKEGNTAFAVVSPGKAYVHGKEVINVSTTKLPISPVEITQSKPQQRTGVNYGQYFTYANTDQGTVDDFLVDGSRYDLYNGSTVIGSCSIANITPGRIYVYAVTKLKSGTDYTSTAVTKIENTVITSGGQLFEPSQSAMIFDSGKVSLDSVNNVSVVKRVRESIGDGSTTTFVIPSTATTTPVTGDVLAIASNNVLHTVSSTSYHGSGGISVVFDTAPTSGSSIYYNAVETNVPHDTLGEREGYVKTIYNATNFGQIGVPNCIEIISVQDNFGDADLNSVDVTKKFRLVRNQKDGYYGRSFIRLYAGESLDNDNLLIRFRYLKRTSTVGGGYLIPDSYDTVTSKNLIHRYTSKALDDFNLLNSFDFRPYATRLATPSLGKDGAPTINSATMASVNISRGLTPANNATITGDMTYYMSRIDSVVLDEYSNITLLKGGESENPSRPNAQGLYSIGNVTVPGNNSDITGEDRISIDNTSTKNYTMEDIGRIQNKIDSLVDIVSLSLLEQKTSSLLITDENGNDRFKNGILADSIKDLSIADIRDPEFIAAIDKGRTVATPLVNQFPLDLKVSSSGSSGVNVSFPDLVTVADTGTKVSVISQPYATTFRNCVSNFYSYKGKTVIDPPFNSGYDVIKNPEVNIEIDIAGPMLDLVDNIQQIMPLTSETLLEEERIGTTRPRRRVIMGQFNQTIEEKSLSSSTSSLNQAVGNFITDINMKPYLRRQKINILATGLRPNTRHYFFFDEKSVDAHVSPARIIGFGRRGSSTLDIKRVRSAWHSRKGTAVRTDSKGILSATFALPANTFFVGENVLEIVDVDQYESIDSASTSYSRATYRGYNFAVNKTDLSVTTRTPDFDTDVNIIQREVERQVGDPIAQTFKVKSSSTKGANTILLSDIEVYFKTKSPTVGVTLQVREVINGYPSKTVLPFASKHLQQDQVYVSSNGTISTTFTFDNPVKLEANKEYAFVVMPDANSPDYLIYTSKVGENSLSKGTTASSVPVTNDWGDGVLFTSTNDSAWKSYQDEDIKFDLKRYEYNNATSATDSYAIMVPNDLEFLNIRELSGNFLLDELAYIKKSQSYTASVSGDDLNILNISGATVFAEGEYIYLETSTGDNSIVAKILNIDVQASGSTITLDTPFFEATTTAVAHVCVAGKVSHFNPNKQDSLHIKESSANSANYIDDNANVSINELIAKEFYTITDLGTGGDTATQWNSVGAGSSAFVGQIFEATGLNSDGDGTARLNDQTIVGIDSGASAKVSAVTNQKISYFQPQIYTSNSINTSIFAELFEGNVKDKDVPLNSNIYTQNNIRTIPSKSKIVDSGDSTVEDFSVRVHLKNNGYTATSPILDATLSELNVYQYRIDSEDDKTSQWVTKEVSLTDGLYSKGMRVLLSAYRPPGTFVDVYARFVYPENIEEQGDWMKLDNTSPQLYSNVSNTRDYRDFEYNFPEDKMLGEANAVAPYTLHREYSTFQLKFVLRHGKTGAGLELDTPELNTIVPDINLFTHVFDYRAIALT